jgi:hypothetical protein
MKVSFCRLLTASASIRRAMLPNRRRIGWLSASLSVSNVCEWEVDATIPDPL